MIKVLLVDDQMLFAQSLKMTIENYAKDISVAGIASNGSEAVDMAAALSPDVVLMDVYMKKMDGIYATKLIHQRFPDMKILMLSTYGDDIAFLEIRGKIAPAYIYMYLRACREYPDYRIDLSIYACPMRYLKRIAKLMQNTP